MGKIKKSTRKFITRHLPKVLEKRKEIKKIKARQKPKTAKKERAVDPDIVEVPTNQRDGPDMQGSEFSDDDMMDNAAAMGLEDQIDKEYTEEGFFNEEDGVEGEAEGDEEIDYEGGLPEFDGGEQGEEVAEEEADDEEFIGPEKVLTSSQFNKWVDLAVNQHSGRALKRLVAAFRVACRSNDTRIKSKKQGKGSKGGKGRPTQLPFQILSTSLFDHVILISVQKIPSLFDYHLKLKPKENAKKEPTASGRWEHLEPVVKSFMGNLLHYIDSMPPSEIPPYVVSYLADMLHYVGALPKLSVKFLKAVLRLWAEGAEKIRLLAFVVLRQMATALPYPFISNVLKGVYLTYVRHSKLVHANKLRDIDFMANCVVELYSIDFVSSYQHAFVYLRQSAIHLRNCLSLKTKEAYKNVYNWQNVNALKVWVLLISQHPTQPDLRQLAYPLIQILLSLIRLIPTAQHFPLRFNVIRMLLQLGATTGLFINVAPYLLQVLHSSVMTGKTFPSNARPIDFNLTLKVPKSLVNTKIYQDGVIEQFYELMLEYFGVYAYSIAFPEITLPAIYSIKKFVKACKVPAFVKKLKMLLEKVESNTVFISTLRAKVNYGPKDLAKAENFAAEEKHNGQSPLIKYYRQYMAGQKTRVVDSRAYADSDDDDRYDANEMDSHQLAQLNQSKKRKAPQPASNDKKPKVAAAKPKSKGAKVRPSTTEDVVEDLVLDD